MNETIEEKQAINVAVPKSLYTKVKLRAARDGKKLQALIIEALNQYFKQNK